MWPDRTAVWPHDVELPRTGADNLDRHSRQGPLLAAHGVELLLTTAGSDSELIDYLDQQYRQELQQGSERSTGGSRSGRYHELYDRSAAAVS